MKPMRSHTVEQVTINERQVVIYNAFTQANDLLIEHLQSPMESTFPGTITTTYDYLLDSSIAFGNSKPVSQNAVEALIEIACKTPIAITRLGYCLSNLEYPVKYEILKKIFKMKKLEKLADYLSVENLDMQLSELLAQLEQNFA